MIESAAFDMVLGDHRARYNSITRFVLRALSVLFTTRSKSLRGAFMAVSMAAAVIVAAAVAVAVVASAASADVAAALATAVATRNRHCKRCKYSRADSSFLK